MADEFQNSTTASDQWSLDQQVRLLTFYATTLKSLDKNFDLTACCNSVMTVGAKVAVENMADWCRIDMREDLGVGPGTVAHKEQTLIPFLNDIQFANADDLLSPLRVMHSGVAISQPFYISIPIKKAGDTIGCLTLARAEESASFDAVDAMMAGEFANKLAVNLERALLYKNLAEMKNAAEAASSAKTNFIANVSHEIRTPLGAIVGFSDLLTNSVSTSEERAQWAGKVRTNSTYLLRIIDDILDISKVEAGKVELEIAELDLQELLREIKAFAKLRASGKDVRFEVVIAGELPRFIKSDSTRLSQILSNLIGNAIKFTSHGFVRLTVSKPENQRSLSFEIADSGIGISSSQAEILFQPFTQADASHTRQFGGTGLGLALSRTLARRLGGDLVLVDSEPSRGSTFLVTVDCITPKSGPTFKGVWESSQDHKINVVDVTALEFTNALQGREILLVEDSADIQVLIKRFLEGAGAVISLANNGEEGLRSARLRKFDVILMDVQMPVKDGCQTVSELRAEGYEGLIVALTANTMKEERERCLAAGFNVHLSKPIRRHDLIQKLMGYIGQFENRKSATDVIYEI
ncbi:hybrid sensor histidine kinase/response regulator [Bdellovibrio sp. HCB209]|uniref:ATP-binding response regulator n=1 Tax=Bdellovibrio sp. HCB209 TaxID=3394354 RepID=UPI0039B3F848